MAMGSKYDLTSEANLFRSLKRILCTPTDYWVFFIFNSCMGFRINGGERIRIYRESDLLHRWDKVCISHGKFLSSSGLNPRDFGGGIENDGTKYQLPWWW